MKPEGWRVRLGARARADYRSILTWTGQSFGPGQVAAYQLTIDAAIATLRSGPLVPGSVQRDNYGTGVRTLHVARGGRRGSHVLVYREGARGTIEIVRILHDAMDLPSHLT